LQVFYDRLLFFDQESDMDEARIMDALRDKRSELAGMIGSLEQQLGRRRADLAHIDATMRLFDPSIEAIRPAPAPARQAWFRPGECRRFIYDVLRETPGPLTARVIAGRVMAAKGLPADDRRTNELIYKTVLGSLNRAADTIERVEAAGTVAWRVI
jgi:hypothetical protein